MNIYLITAVSARNFTIMAAVFVNIAKIFTTDYWFLALEKEDSC